MHHHGPECHARRFLCFLQVQGHGEGFYNHICLFLSYLLKVLTVLQPNLIGWYIIISWSVLCKIQIVIFKTTEKVQNFIDALCILYLLYH